MTALRIAERPADAVESSLRLARIAQQERDRLADFLVALAEIDRHRLWLELGHPSLLSFLTRELGLSSASAYQRKVAAELIQRYPEVVDAVRDGRLCLTRVVDLGRVMTEDNRAEVLPRFCREVRRAA